MFLNKQGCRIAQEIVHHFVFVLYSPACNPSGRPVSPHVMLHGTRILINLNFIIILEMNTDCSFQAHIIQGELEHHSESDAG